mgnify:FL=1
MVGRTYQKRNTRYRVIFIAYLAFVIILPRTTRAETLVTCPKSDSCLIDIYNVVNTPLYKAHTITLIQPTDGEGNPTSLNTQCSRGVWIEERNRCEADPQCSGPGSFSSTYNLCIHDPICPTGQGEYQVVQDLCFTDPVCGPEGVYSETNIRCQTPYTLSNVCPYGTYNESAGSCQIAPSCEAPSVYNSTTKRCELTAGASCPAGGSYSSATGICQAAATISSCKTSTAQNVGCFDMQGSALSGYCSYYQSTISGCLLSTGLPSQGYNYTTCLYGLSPCVYDGITYPSPVWVEGACPHDTTCYVQSLSQCPDNVAPANASESCRQYSTTLTYNPFSACPTPPNWYQGTCTTDIRYDYVSCPSGYTIQDGACQAPPAYDSCPVGFTQESGLCYNIPDCPQEYGLDITSDMCSLVMEASYSCPENYTFSAPEHLCVKEPECSSSSYAFDGSLGHCTAQASCETGYTLDTNLDRCTSSDMCGPEMTYLPDENICIQELAGGLYAVSIEYDGIRYDLTCDGNEYDLGPSVSSETQNKIICTINEDGDRVTMSLSLYDQTTYSTPYSVMPCDYDGNICNTSKDDPFCANDDPRQAEACKWQIPNTNTPDLTDHGIPLGSWATFAKTTVINLSLGFLVPEPEDIGDKCAMDINGNGEVEAAEMADCTTTPQGSLCTLDTADCGMGTVPVICPEGGSWENSRDICLQELTSDCPDGMSWSQLHNQCESEPVCPSSSTEGGGTFNGVHDLCEITPLCPAGIGTYNPNRDLCETLPSCPNGTWNPAALRCEAPYATQYTCSSGVYVSSRNRCERAPSCRSGSVFSSANHRCEIGGTVSCPSPGSFNSITGRCETSLLGNRCYTSTQYIEITGLTYTNACYRVYGRCRHIGDCAYNSYTHYYCGLDEPEASCSGCTRYRCAGDEWGDDCETWYNPTTTCPFSNINPANQSGGQCSGNTQPSGSTEVASSQTPSIVLNGSTYNVNCEQRHWYDYAYCPAGYTRSGSICYVEETYSCPSGFTWSGSICYTPPTCLSGWAFDSATNTCYTTPTVTISCPAGYTYTSAVGLCIKDPDSCPSNLYLLNLSTGMCEAQPYCPQGYSLSAIFNVCAAQPECIEGSQLDSFNDVCAASTVCGTGYTAQIHPENGPECIAEGTCPPDYHLDLTQDLCLHDWPDVCPYGADRPCMNNHGQWQCSAHDCAPIGDLALDEDTVEGADDLSDDGFEQDGTCLGKIYIFNGADKRCRQAAAGTAWENCCFTGDEDSCKHNTWIGYSTCNAREMDLACRRYNGLCVEVGSYCAKRIPLVGCVQRKTTYCCFNSKFGRIIQEQGRPLLQKYDPAAPFGSAKHPDCKGFEPEDFSMLDFGKIDFSETFPDISPMPQDIFENNTTNSLQDKMDSIQ